MSEKKNILFIHQSFPGQFAYLAPVLAKDGHQVVALTLNKAPEVPGVKVLPYKLDRKTVHGLPYLLQEQDSKILRAEGVAKTCKEMRDKGFFPDVVYVHPGWGEAMYVKTIWPETRLVVYGEWFYNTTGQEVDFDPEFGALDFEEKLRLKLKNNVLLQALNDADTVISPTKWQKSRFPDWVDEKIKVIHDGLHTEVLKPNPKQTLKLQEKNLTFSRKDSVITFAARYLEPVRGFHQFMRSLPEVLNNRPEAHVLIMGKDTGDTPSGYGRTNPSGQTWRRALLDELGDRLDADRVHFLGFQSHQAYLAALQISTCHVYLTYPFVLSWSFLEAGFLGLPIVAADTAPVREFEHLQGLYFCDFHDTEDISRKILHVLETRPALTPNQIPEVDLKQVLKMQRQVLLEESSGQRIQEPEAIETVIESTEPPAAQEQPPAGGEKPQWQRSAKKKSKVQSLRRKSRKNRQK
ncbi:MAG: glycosyltransferase [Desulfohalobiaceae bacterium]|nr:glycosyltransferase [Desulfohalobiaceae bacterium]